MFQYQRITLRAVEPADLEAIWRFNNDLEVELAGGGDPPMPQSRARLEQEYSEKWSQGGRDGMAFAITVDEQLIGHCALFATDAVARSCELGITIGERSFWNLGYGRETVALLLRIAFHYHNLRRVTLHVHARNERAIRVYRACGFVEEGRMRAHVWSNGAYDDLVVMGILRAEWQEQTAAEDAA